MVKKTKKRLLSGVKPSGKPHIGNYLGAMRQFVDLADSHESFVFVADYHAMNTVHDADELRQNIKDIVLDYLAIGLNPKEVTLFKQSDFPEHTELCWIFNTFTTMPYLMRAHAFKDAQAKNKEINVGTFDYPMLMAADILMYEPDIVPVGADQKQHIEYARDTAEKFNRMYGDTFKLPSAHIPKDIAIIPGVDGQKMSKSYNNTIPLFAEDDVIRKAVMSVITDSKGVEEEKDPEECNVYALHKHFSKNDLFDIGKRYEEGSIGYKESKDLLAENIIKFITPMRDKRKELVKDVEIVDKVLKIGYEKAHVVVSEKMKEIKKKIGVLD